MFKIFRILWKYKKPLLLFAVFQLGDWFEGKDRTEKRESPADLPKQGWRDALRETKAALKDKELGLTAAGLAYYATLTFFPAVLGLAGIYALVNGPSNLLDGLKGLEVVFPPALYGLLQQAIRPVAENSEQHQALAAAIIGIAGLLWTTSGGLQNLIKGTNQVYEVKETRKFVKLRLTSLALSLILLIAVAFILFLLLLQGDALRQWGWPGWTATLFPFLRWPVLVVILSAILAIIYRYAPNRENPRWQWVSWGAGAASVLWLIASALFFVYAQNFADFNKTYGAFAGIIVLMTWFNLTALIILVAGQVNKKLEAVSSRKY